MDLALSEEQLQLVEAISGLLARESSSDRVRSAEPSGFDAKLWSALLDAGVVHMAVDEDGGGWGATVVDLALVAEQLGRALGSAPVVETQVAAMVLRECARSGSADADRLLASVLAGERLVTFAPRVGRNGRLDLVPGAAVADAVIALADGRLLYVELEDNRTAVANLGSMPLADVKISGGATVLVESRVAAEVFERAVDRWLKLTAAMLVGGSARALEITVDYARERRAFGAPIGSFQAISHRLADSATAIDGARLLVYRAACADVDEAERASELAAMAFAFAYEAARDVTHRGIHFHGGYGFMMEQDIQLYYRRVRSWANVFGDASAALDRVAAKRYLTL
jgi:alkylation response protein AidB-like acyl-CoA dehydrogenase